MMTSKTYDREFKLACVNASTWQRQLVDIYSHRHVSSPHVWINAASSGREDMSGDDSIAASGTTRSEHM